MLDTTRKRILSGKVISMYRRVVKYIQEEKLLEQQDRVVVALSGGGDSVCLLSVLVKLREEMGLKLLAVHVHHGLRGEEADRDMEFSERLCRELKVKFDCAMADVKGTAQEMGLSLEEAGRKLRYEFLEKKRVEFGGGKIAVAHHKDDQAETILYHLCRGTGLKGLGGMSPRRETVIRPLLCVGKEEILAYLREEKLEWCLDSTNLETEYTRNKIRCMILPLLKDEINARAVEHIVSAGTAAAEAADYLEKKGREIFTRFGEGKKGSYAQILAKVLAEQEPVIKTYVIRAMISLVYPSGKDITRIHINEVLNLAEKQTGKEISLPYGLKAGNTYGKLWIKIEEKGDVVEGMGEAALSGTVYSIFSYKKGEKIPENRYTKWFDYDKINSTLSVRTRKTGDYITLKGGGKKTVKAFMIDEKIPREERDRILLVADGSHVLWIIGYRISEYYKVTDNTHTVLQIQLNGGKNNG